MKPCYDGGTCRNESEIEELRAQVDQLRVQLAGCSVAAMGGTSEDVVAKPGAYGYSPAYQAVLDLRRKYDIAVRALRKIDNPQLAPTVAGRALSEIEGMK